MRVKIEFEDNTAFTAKEIEQSYQLAYGKNSKVEVLPHNDSPEASIYFGIQNLITLDQLDYYYEYYPHLYPTKLKELKIDTLAKISQIFDQVVLDNENRVKE